MAKPFRKPAVSMAVGRKMDTFMCWVTFMIMIIIIIIIIITLRWVVTEEVDYSIVVAGK